MPNLFADDEVVAGVELALQFVGFKNIDLFSQGIYQLRVSAHGAHSGRQGAPFALLEAPSEANTNVPDVVASKEALLPAQRRAAELEEDLEEAYQQIERLRVRNAALLDREREWETLEEGEKVEGDEERPREGDGAELYEVEDEEEEYEYEFAAEEDVESAIDFSFLNDNVSRLRLNDAAGVQHIVELVFGKAIQERDRQQFCGYRSFIVKIGVFFHKRNVTKLPDFGKDGKFYLRMKKWSNRSSGRFLVL
jgi:hypothetical protein